MQLVRKAHNTIRSELEFFSLSKQLCKYLAEYEKKCITFALQHQQPLGLVATLCSCSSFAESVVPRSCAGTDCCSDRVALLWVGTSHSWCEDVPSCARFSRVRSLPVLLFYSSLERCLVKA